VSDENSIPRLQARLWIFGDAVGAACWRKGYEARKLQMTPRQTRSASTCRSANSCISPRSRIWLQKNDANDRGIEMQRFDGEDHALAEPCPRATGTGGSGTAPPFEHPVNRQALIRHWWPLERKRA